MAVQTTDVLYNKVSRYNISGNEEGFVMEDFKKYNLTYTETFVRQGEEHRPELIAQRIYGDARMWWVICRFNGLLDPNNIPMGLKLRIPDFGVI
mgnify:CR=1 FL=1